MQRSTDRLLTTFVGSLIRPPEVLALDDETDEAKKTEVLRSAVDDVVRQQADIGIDYISDGEFGKSSWFSYVMERLDGYEVRPVPRPAIGFLGRDETNYPDFFSSARRGGLGARRHVCVGPSGTSARRTCSATLTALLAR